MLDTATMPGPPRAPPRPPADLVARARSGDGAAWDALVDRYAPLVWSICYRYRLGRADAEDVTQSVWMRLVAHLGTVRDPDALPGWLRTITERRCLDVLTARRPSPYPPDLDALPDAAAGPGQVLVAAERAEAVRAAMSALPPQGRALIGMLAEDPPRPYAEVAAELGIPVGSVGPVRRRYLEQMRRHPAIAGLAG